MHQSDGARAHEPAAAAKIYYRPRLENRGRAEAVQHAEVQ